MTLNQFMERCRGEGVRVTPQRIAVFECVTGKDRHLSAEEVFRQVRARHPTLSFATVYNTLDMLTRLGVVRAVAGDERRRRYDANLEPHYHAICRNCHRITDVPTGDAALGELQRADLAALDFVVEAVAVEFSGLCGNCSRGGQASPQPVAPAT